jgi:hypothetical protein
MDLMSDIHLLPKPLACNIARIALYSTLSNAFSKSIFRIIIGFLETWQIWRYSNVQARQPCIFLPLMNLNWYLKYKYV